MNLWIIIGALAAALLTGSFVGGCEYRAQKDAAAQATQVAQLKKEQADAIARNRLEVEKAGDAYSAELQRLRAALALEPVPVARVCVQAGPVPAPAADRAPAHAGGATAAGGSVQPVPDGTGVGPDIGPELRLLAERADELSAQVRALQAVR